jgi:hypothetical protein
LTSLPPSSSNHSTRHWPGSRDPRKFWRAHRWVDWSSSCLRRFEPVDRASHVIIEWRPPVSCALPMVMEGRRAALRDGFRAAAWPRWIAHTDLRLLPRFLANTTLGTMVQEHALVEHIEKVLPISPPVAAAPESGSSRSLLRGYTPPKNAHLECRVLAMALRRHSLLCSKNMLGIGGPIWPLSRLPRRRGVGWP